MVCPIYTVIDPYLLVSGARGPVHLESVNCDGTARAAFPYDDNACRTEAHHSDMSMCRGWKPKKHADCITRYIVSTIVCLNTCATQGSTPRNRVSINCSSHNGRSNLSCMALPEPEIPPWTRAHAMTMTLPRPGNQKQLKQRVHILTLLYDLNLPAPYDICIQ
jgi:hypothetical protein